MLGVRAARSSGLCCLGWVAYQYVATNLVAPSMSIGAEARRYARPGSSNAEAIRRAPANFPRVRARPSVCSEFRPWVRRTKFRSLGAPGSDVVAKGVGHYTSTALPGQIGNFALTGFRVTHGQPFARLLDLGSGDEIIVETRDAILHLRAG